MRGRRAMNESERFWSKVRVAGPEDCWLWIARSITSSGYATFGATMGPVPAHRFAYELLCGPIPEGLHLDHLCRVRLCVNPAHLEPVTVAENNRRKADAATTCRNGHPWTPENTYDYRGYRICRECRRAHDRRRSAARSAAVAERKANRETCANGHPWTSENVRLDRGHPVCRACSRERTRAHRARSRVTD